MSKILGIAFAGHEAAPLAAFAQRLGLPFDLLVLTGNAETDLGAEKVLSAGLSDLPPASALVEALRGHATGYTHIAGISSMASKDVLARLAGALDCAMVTDVIAADSPTVFKRPIVAGSAIATVEVLDPVAVLTVRPAGFGQPNRGGSSAVETISISATSNVVVTNRVQGGGARPDLTQAKIIISGGRPLKDAATFESVLGAFADKVGGAVGATRAAVDSGIAPNELQVGQTGKIVAPDLYIAAGVSGSTQHMAGIKDSKVIVAINKDPDAPIFETADFGLVADLFDAVPELTSKV
jgi:electron transfer flavoprotein alpha subunit